MKYRRLIALALTGLLFPGAQARTIKVGELNGY